MLWIMKTSISAAYAFLILLLALLFNGCAFPDPPEYYSIDSGFEDQEQETIRAGFAAWCEVVDYCPKETLWSERGWVRLVDDIAEPERVRRVCPTCAVSGMNMHADGIEIARNRVSPDSMDSLWWVVAHEIGHYRTEHTATGLMAETPPAERVFEIDDAAVEAWHVGNAGQ